MSNTHQPTATTRDEAACAIPGTPLAQAAAGIDACVHCGFCLQACPTYLALEDENDSPRGRLVLMRALLDGDVALSDDVVQQHMDRCLGCRACETACPSGVPYGQLLEATRATMRRVTRPPLLARLILGVFASRPLLASALFCGRIVRALGLPSLLARLPGRIGTGMAMLASTRSVLGTRTYVPPQTRARGEVTLLRGCVMDGLFAATNAATERTLRVNGYRLVDTARQACCGALHAHAGDLQGARALARANIAAFERAPDAAIAVNAAGCGAMLKEYAHLFQDDPDWRDRALRVSARTRDATELLAAAGPKRASLPARISVTYDAPCHLQHAQRITAPPIAVRRQRSVLRIGRHLQFDRTRCLRCRAGAEAPQHRSNWRCVRRHRQPGMHDADWCRTAQVGCRHARCASDRPARCRVRCRRVHVTPIVLLLEVEELVFDTLALRSEALRDAMAVEGVTLRLADVRAAHTGATAAMTLDALCATGALDATGRELVLRRTTDGVRARLDQQPPSFDAEARDTLAQLCVEFSLAVVTRATREEAQRMLEQAGLEECVRTIRSLGTLPASEQHTVWSEVARAMRPARVVAVAPAPLLAAARQAGLTTIAIGASNADTRVTLVSLSQLDASFIATIF
jgi:glycolate oxidase iron-sulfur subunit